MRLRCMCLIALCMIAAPCFSATLKIELAKGAKAAALSTNELLARGDITTVDIPADVAFHRSMRYRAIRITALLPDLNAADHLQFVASDGFSAEIEASTILNRQGSTAWLAIEDPAHPWPKLPDNKGDAGPFYVVWTHPEKASIGTEQWPYQLTTIRALDSVAKRFPAIVPSTDAGANASVQKGFAVFQRTCFACHTLNGEGDGRQGPDLNIPQSPTDYFRDSALRAYIRNPASLRSWPGMKMPGFPTQQALSDDDLNALLAYLHDMARHRPTH